MASGDDANADADASTLCPDDASTNVNTEPSIYVSEDASTSGPENASSPASADDRKGKSNAENITGGSGGEGGKGGKGGFGGGKGGFGGSKGGFDGGKGYKSSGKGGFDGDRSGGGGDGRTIYVSGFDFGADEALLQDHFGGVGTIATLSLQGNGAALIQYVEAASAQRAVAELDRTTMDGHSRYCSVKMDGERKGKGKGKKY